MLASLRLTLRDRWAAARADPAIHRRFRQLLILSAVGGASWAVNHGLCARVPEELEPACHAAGKVAQLLGLALGSP